MADKEGFFSWSQLLCLWASLLSPNPSNYRHISPKRAFTQAKALANSHSFFTAQLTYHFFREYFLIPQTLYFMVALGIAH